MHRHPSAYSMKTTTGQVGTATGVSEATSQKAMSTKWVTKCHTNPVNERYGA